MLQGFEDHFKRVYGLEELPPVILDYNIYFFYEYGYYDRAKEEKRASFFENLRLLVLGSALGYFLAFTLLKIWA